MVFHYCLLICNHNVGIDAFQTEFLAGAAPYPLAKSTIMARDVIQDICNIIQELPSHLSQLAALIESILIEYYEKTMNRCGFILSSSDITSEEDIDIASFQWARDRTIADILRQRTNVLDLDVGV
jgi:hypothetical protein